VATEIPPQYAASIRRWGRLADAEARKWGLTGEQLLAKLLAGESGFRMDAVSSAGARAAGQFMPETRAEFIRVYGVDPWGSVDDAVHSAALFMRDRGLDSYNPGGGQEYIDYILGQDVAGVGKGPLSRLTRGRSRERSTPTTSGEVFGPEQRSGALRALLWVVFVFGGAILSLAGFARLTGVNPGIVIPGPVGKVARGVA
jgi:membrane-bound lytic murein transglycosylase B